MVMDSDLEHLAGLLRRESETSGVRRTFVLHLGPKPAAPVKDRSQDQIVTQRIAPIRLDV
jgi:hypothetical protein